MTEKSGGAIMSDREVRCPEKRLTEKSTPGSRLTAKNVQTCISRAKPLVARWAELRQGPMAEDAILGRIAGYDETLAPAIDANFERWPIKDIAFKTDFVDNWLCPVDSYADEHARVLTFVSDRLAWMDANVATF